MIILAILAATIVLYALLAHHFSYYFEKKRILNERKWGLNICCGKTDGGGLNVDIVKHQDLPNFRKIDNIYELPFKDAEFDTVLCSHTMEHVDDPARFFAELRRVGKSVTVVIPPLYDIGAVLNMMEHKWIFLTFKKQHHDLPRFTRLPLAGFLQKHFGQKNHA